MSRRSPRVSRASRNGGQRRLVDSGQRTPSHRSRSPVARRGRRRWSGVLAVVLVLAGVFAVGAGLGQSGNSPLGWLRLGQRPPPWDFPVLEPSRPVRIVVKSIKVNAPVHQVGLAADGSIAVPALERHNETGWYDRGPTPGQFGPAIIVGHADTRTGPSVFHNLSKLRPGARVEVTRADQSVAVFEVNSVERFDKSGLPADRVYGDFARPGLRLITCGGQWVGGSIGYADNVVAFASLIKSRGA
ncbi:class F sortase [Micromonospora sonneratiae]|uniref:Class F sortase n=1 Tax=Micromonospora sonneratiae TaxID=1184706 RepID=A0ABW3YIK8_9ACTN